MFVTARVGRAWRLVWRRRTLLSQAASLCAALVPVEGRSLFLEFRAHKPTEDVSPRDETSAFTSCVMVNGKS